MRPVKRSAEQSPLVPAAGCIIVSFWYSVRRRRGNNLSLLQINSIADTAVQVSETVTGNLQVNLTEGNRGLGMLQVCSWQ